MTVLLAGAIASLNLLAVACQDHSPVVGVGRALAIEVANVETLTEVSHAVDNQIFTLRPSAPDGSLLSAHVTLRNEKIGVALLLVDEQAAVVRNRNLTESYPLLDPFGGESADPKAVGDSAEPSTPPLWGSFSLAPGSEAAGRLVFDLPPGADPFVVAWEQTDDIFVVLPPG